MMMVVARTTGQTSSVFLPGMWSSPGAAIAAPTATIDVVSCYGGILGGRGREGTAATAAAATVDCVGVVVLIDAVAAEQRRQRMGRKMVTLLESRRGGLIRLIRKSRLPFVKRRR